LWIFSKSSFGVFLSNVCLLWQANFQPKKKTGDDFYKSLIVLLYSWFHTGKENKFWQNFTILLSLVAIENL
jgi:hypothetical protein